MKLSSFRDAKNFVLNYTRSFVCNKKNYIPSSLVNSSITKRRLVLTERKAAIDVGSGGTKVLIGDVDRKTNQIVNVVFEHSFPVPYQTYLEASKDQTFNAEIREQGLKTFSQISELLDQHQVSKVKAVATEAFRKAANGESFAKTVAAQTRVPLEVISQREEGAIGFYSASSSSGKNPEKLLTLDIGTGSFQIAAKERDKGLVVYMQSMGSIPFKNCIIREVQRKNPSTVSSPNPMTEEEWKKADAIARTLGRDAYPELKAKVSEADNSVIGIGRLFSSSIQPIGTTPGVVTRKDLRNFIRSQLGKTDEELGDPFASVNLSNCILVRGIMKALDIQKIQIVETTSTRGLMSYTSV